MRHVLVTDYVHPILITGLRALGYAVHYAPEIERPLVLQWVGNCTGLVINTKTIADAELIGAARELKWIGRLGSGLDIIDLESAEMRSIAVINAPEANANAVAEHVFGMLLCLIRNIAIADREVRNGYWNREKNRGHELRGKTVGVIGYGNNGSAFASKFKGWDVQVLTYDKYKTNIVADHSFIAEVTLETLISRSDIISLHVPLTAETKYMVNDVFLSKCKAGAILINSARGKVVDTKALLTALESGRLAGACLDVFENEKPETHTAPESQMYASLAALENIILTPHIAGWTFESKRQIAVQITAEVSRL